MQRQLGRKQSYRKMIRDAAESKIEKVKILNAETTLRAIESADRDDMLPDRPDLAENDQAPVPDTEYSFMDMDYYAASAVNSL